MISLRLSPFDVKKSCKIQILQKRLWRKLRCRDAKSDFILIQLVDLCPNALFLLDCTVTSINPPLFIFEDDLSCLVSLSVDDEANEKGVPLTQSLTHYWPCTSSGALVWFHDFLQVLQKHVDTTVEELRGS